METITIKSGKRYREMVYINGRLFKSPSFKRKSDAIKWKSQKVYEGEQFKLHGNASIEKDTTLSDFTSNWLSEVVMNQRTERTHTNYTSIIKNHLIPFFKKRKLKDINLNDGNLLVQNLKDKGHNSKGINLIIGLLKTILIEARRQQIILKNPLEDFRSLKLGTREFQYFSKPEINQFLAANLNNPLYSFYFVSIYTGMRRGELAGLKWDRIDFVNNQIIVSRILDRTGLKERTKSNKKRIVPIHPEVKKILAALHRQQSSQGFVFCSKDGSPLDVNHIYRWFKQAQKKAGIVKPIRFHDLRHTFASHYMMNGGNMFDLQKILGHSDIQMTMRYSHFSPDHLQKSIRFMGLGDGFNHNLTTKGQDEAYGESSSPYLKVVNN